MLQAATAHRPKNCILLTDLTRGAQASEPKSTEHLLDTERLNLQGPVNKVEVRD